MTFDHDAQTFRLPQGYATAVSPITAGAIATNTNGLIGVRLTSRPAMFAFPLIAPSRIAVRLSPAVVVVQETFGIHEHIKDLCRRLARSGYLVVAQHLYTREGDVKWA
jgi:carboxymethylenebutenolidase